MRHNIPPQGVWPVFVSEPVSLRLVIILIANITRQRAMRDIGDLVFMKVGVSFTLRLDAFQ
jgi:hypothetical protein